MARREASNALLHFYHEIGHKQYPTWLVHPQVDYQRVVFVGFATRHLYFVIFQRNKRKARVVSTALPLLSLGLQDISFALNLEFVYPKTGVQTKAYRQGCG